jgi:hypothetical protein
MTGMGLKPKDKGNNSKIGLSVGQTYYFFISSNEGLKQVFIGYFEDM